MAINANFLAKNNLKVHQKIFTLEFLGTDYVFTTHNISDLPVAKTQIVGLRTLPIVNDDRIDPIELQNIISDMDFEIIDFSNQMTGFLKDYSPYKYPILVKHGFEGLAYTDFINIFEGTTINFSPSVINQTYNLSVGNKLKKIEQSIFNDRNLLYRSVDSEKIPCFYNITMSNLVKVGATNVASGSLTNSINDGDFQNITVSSGGSVNYLNLVIEFTSGNHNGLTYQIDGQNSQVLSIANEQFDFVTYGEPATNDTYIIYDIDSVQFACNWLDLLNYILNVELGLISKTQYDLNPSNYETYDYLDESITDLRDNFFSFLETGGFKIFEPIDNALEWIEEQIFKSSQTFLITNLEGKLELTFNQQPQASDSLVELWDYTSAANIAEILEPDSRSDYIITRLIFKYDYDYTDKEYKTIDVYDNDTAIEKHGQQKTITFESLLLKTGNNASIAIASLKERIFSRFSDYVIYYKYVIASSLGLEIKKGDSILLNSNKNPNFQTGDKSSGKRLMQVMSKTINYQDNEIELELLDTQYIGVGTIWAGTGTTETFANATAEEQAFYMYWGDANGQLTDENGAKVDGKNWADV